jgi:hypothetical protein
LRLVAFWSKTLRFGQKRFKINFDLKQKTFSFVTAKRKTVQNLNLNLRHKERPKRNNARGSHGAMLQAVRCATHIRDDATGLAPFDRYGNK